MPDACAHEWADTGLTLHRRPVKRCTRCGKRLKAHAACAGYGFLEEGPGADRFCLGCDGVGLVIVAEYPPATDQERSRSRTMGARRAKLPESTYRQLKAAIDGDES